METDELTKDEKVRVLASMRTDINKMRLTLDGLLTQDSNVEEDNEGNDLAFADEIERAQERMARTVRHLNEAIKLLGGHA